MNKFVKRFNGSIVLSALIAFFIAAPVQAQQVDDFYVPLPETSALAFFENINNATSETSLITRTDIVIRDLGTEIVYDAFSDGYETDYVLENAWATSTERWGDNDCSNGFNPNHAVCDGTTPDILDVGEVLVFDEDLDNSDGARGVFARDYFSSNKTINLTRSMWPTVPSTLLAGAFELFPSAQWGTSYVLPIGEGTTRISGSGDMFEQVALTVMASDNGTSVEFDPDGPGPLTAITQLINRGESIEYGLGAGANGQALDILTGATVVSDAPVQVNILTGDIGSTYEARFYTLFPDSLLSDKYYEAVGTTLAGNDTAVFLHNPNPTSITVEVFLNSGPITASPTTVTIAPNTTVKQIVPTATAQGLTGIRFESTGGEIYSAYTAVDDNDSATDWGHVTTPLRLMGDTIRVGFAPGRDPLSTSTENASPVWLIADVPGQGAGQDIEICVDAGGDGGALTDPFTTRTYDYSFVTQPLDSTRLYDNGVSGGAVNNNSGSQTGMLAFACDTGTAGDTASPATIILAAAWGQDPQFASPASPGFDVGTTIRTGSNNRLFIGDLVFVDTNANGQLDVGEVGIANQTVRITTTGSSDVDPDTPGIQNTRDVQTDANGLYLFTGLTTGEDYTVEVIATSGMIQTYDPDNILDNATTVTPLNGSTLEADFGYVIELGIDKTSATEGTPVAPGSTIPYTIVVINDTPIVATNVVLTDVLPAGVTYVPGTAMKTYPIDGGAPVTGTFSSPNLAAGNALDVTGVPVTASYTTSLTDPIPSNATLTSYSISLQGDPVNGSYQSEIDLLATTPTATILNIDFGDDLGLPGNANAYSVVQGPISANGTALGLFEITLSEDFNDTGLDNDVASAIFTIDWTAPGRTTTTDTAQDPSTGNLVLASDGVDLLPGESMTVVFNVTVDTPFTLPSTTLTNTATVTSDQSVIPNSDDAEDIVTAGEISGNVSDTEGNNLSGVVIELYSDPNGDGNPADAVLIATTTTDASGNYAFTNVSAGDYFVSEIDPSGYQAFSDDDSTSGGDDAANVSQTDNLLPVTLFAGEADTGNDFVDAQVGSIAGQVWLDEDQDGLNDIEEAGLTNVVVELRDGVCTPSVNCPTVNTDQFGNYAFTDLPPGNYDIAVISGLPSGVSPTAGPFMPQVRPVSLVAGEEVSNQDFGYIANPNTGIIGDRVWSDADGDGIQDAGEAGLAGVTLTLLDGNGVAVPGGTATTNADGDYLFTNVPFGDDYVVVIDQSNTQSNNALDGFSPTEGPQSEGGFRSSPVTLSAALSTVTDIDFGFDNDADTITINDRVWFDSNGDGVEDAGEPGVPGVSVDLVDDSGNVIATTVTDENGDVVFTGVPDGTNYHLIITDRNSELEGLTETTDTDGDAVIAGPLSAAAGDDTLDTVGDDGTPTFGFNNPGSISGTVWRDSDSSEVQNNGEPGIGGVEVTLTPPATIDLGNGLGQPITTTTAADGSYSFDGLPPGDYDLDINSPPSGTHTQDPDADDDNNTTVSLGLGQGAVNQDFGYFDNSLADISGTVFIDLDKDGVEELNGVDGQLGTPDDEVGFAEVTLSLSVDEYEVIDGLIDINRDGATNNADDGQYLGYTIVNGRIDVSGDGSVDLLDDGEINGVPIINGRFDFDGNGNTGNGINGRALDDGTLAAVEIATTTTDANGNYSFPDLPPAEYLVSVTDQDGLLSGYDITSGLDEQSASLAATNIADVDFGYIKDEATGSISGEVFIDETIINGVADDPETNLSGVEVYLCLAEDAPCTDVNAIATTVTDVNGEYVFSNLPADEYVVDADARDPSVGGTVPAGLTLTVDPAVVALSEGENLSDVDVGYQPDANTGLLSGFVWIDVNNDGTFDPAEAPIPGVDIIVLSSAGVEIARGTTGPDGKWLIDGFGSAGGPSLEDGYIVTYDDAYIPANLVTDQPTNLPLGDDLYNPVNLADDVANDDGVISYLDFAFRPLLVGGDLGSIAGTIYSDGDQNDVYTSTSDGGTADGELEGVTLNLLDSSGNIVSTTQSDANGNYLFDGLVDGDYQVVVTDRNNVLQDLNPNDDVLHGGSGNLPTPITITISGANDVVDQDAGYVSDEVLGSIGNRFWFDTNGDGRVDDNEPGVEGVTIQLWLDNDPSGDTPNDPSTTTGAPVLGEDNLIRTAVTDENGEYYFTSLPESQYIARVVDANGFTEGADATNAPTLMGSEDGSEDGLAKPWTYALTKVDGEPNFAADFGVTGVNSIAGTVFIEDEDLAEPVGDDPLISELDGVTAPNPNQISPDSDAVGVTVVLLIEQADGTFDEIQRTTTDINGDYSFVGLPDGNYRIDVLPSGSPIDGFGQTGDPDLVAVANASGNASDLVCDSDTAALCDDSTELTLSGAPVTGVDFGYQKNFTTTPVTINAFSATGGSGTVEFNWETSNEVGHLGYQLYARTDEAWVLLNDSIIGNTDLGDALQTRSYNYTAYNVDAEWFALIDISVNEELTIHGPYKLGEFYGDEIVDVPEFDWGGIDLAEPTKAETQRSVNSRVQRLLQSQNDAADVLEDEELEDEIFDSAVNHGGQW